MLNSFQTLMPNSVAPSLYAKCDKPSGLGFNFMRKPNITSWANKSLKDEKGEIWKPIKRFEKSYLVSNNGRVKSLDRTSERYRYGKRTKGLPIKGKILSINNKQTGGYCGVKLSAKTGTAKQINFKVHRLVAEAFIPNPENKSQVNHDNNIKVDNSVGNLIWATASENIQHSFDNGFHKPHKDWLATGGKNPKSKPVEQYTLDGKYITTHDSQRGAYRATGVDQSMIWSCCNGKQSTGGGFKWKYPKGIYLGDRGAIKSNPNYFKKSK
jgi:hypothetical protein